MKTQNLQRYFWFKYFLAVILLIILVILFFASDIRAGIFLMLFLGARTVVGPVQIHRLTKKGKFDDIQYIKIRNKLNVIVGIGVIAIVVLLFIVLVFDLFVVGALSIPLLSILTVFIVIDVGCDILTFIRLEKISV